MMDHFLTGKLLGSCWFNKCMFYFTHSPVSFQISGFKVCLLSYQNRIIHAWCIEKDQIVKYYKRCKNKKRKGSLAFAPLKPHNN